MSAQGRFVRAPSFTRYFSVLAFGDSLTWGTGHDLYRGPQKVSSSLAPVPASAEEAASQESPQFGPYALVSNAGWPGEWVTAGRLQQQPGRHGAGRSLHCGPGQLLLPDSRRPADYFTPYDVAVFLEGVNDLNATPCPAT